MHKTFRKRQAKIMKGPKCTSRSEVFDRMPGHMVGGWSASGFLGGVRVHGCAASIYTRPITKENN